MLKQEQLHDKHSANSAWIDRIKRRIGLSLLFLAVAASFTSVIAISRSIGSSFSELAKSANSENEQSERPNDARNNAQTGKYVVNNRNSSIASAEIVDSIVGNDLLTATAKETSEEKAEASVVKSKVVKSKVVTSSVALSSVATESVFERLASSSSRRTDSADTVGLYASLTCDLDDWCNEALAGIESIVDGNRGWIAHWVPEKSMTAWFVQASSNANVEQAAGSTSATFQDSSTLPTENQIRDASDTFERIFGDRVANAERYPRLIPSLVNELAVTAEAAPSGSADRLVICRELALLQGHREMISALETIDRIELEYGSTFAWQGRDLLFDSQRQRIAGRSTAHSPNAQLLLAILACRFSCAAQRACDNDRLASYSASAMQSADHSQLEFAQSLVRRVLDALVSTPDVADAMSAYLNELHIDLMSQPAF
jgi:hypothetical protein